MNDPYDYLDSDYEEYLKRRMMMTNIKLKEILRSRYRTMTWLHEKTGISKNTLSLMSNNSSKGIQFDTLEKICNALDITPNDLIDIQQDDFLSCADVKMLADKKTGGMSMKEILAYKKSGNENVLKRVCKTNDITGLIKTLEGTDITHIAVDGIEFSLKEFG